MLDDVGFLAALAAAGFAIILMIVDTLRIRQFIKASVLRTSRFPLFAARDRLRRLVIDGHMEEGNVGWQHLSSAVNCFLNLRNQHDLVQFVENYLSLSIRLTTDPALQKRLDEERGQLDKTASEYPEFRGALEQSEQALFRMLYYRTRPWRFRMLIWRLKLAVLFANFKFRALRFTSLVRGSLNGRIDISKVSLLCK